jgi:GDPmannose 4,6-dehydratase
MKRALITGIGGQDGSFLADILLERDYEIFGIVRRGISEAHENLAHIRHRVELFQADLLDQDSLVDVLRRCRVHEIYNLASASFVPMSWQEPVLTANYAAVGVTSMLEAIRLVDSSARFYQASSSEIFGDPVDSPQSELTPLRPHTPYGVAKAYAHFITSAYRLNYGFYACSGILYNHESPRRPIDFVPRKIARAAAAIRLGIENEVVLGDLNARRDWGYAGDYVEAMWLMLQQDSADDYVIATGVTHSVGELAELAFGHVGLNWRDHVRTDPALTRGPAELRNLVGDASKAREKLGWTPSTSFEELIRILVDADLERLKAESVG